MKKFYNDPTANVSMFDKEDIVTASQPLTAEDQAKAELTAQGVAPEYIATIDITEY